MREQRPKNNKNNQWPPFVPRQVSLAQVKAANQTVQPQPIPSISQATQNPSSPIQDIPSLFSQLRNPEVVDLFNSLQNFVKIAKQHKTRSASLSALFNYSYNDSIQYSMPEPCFTADHILECPSPEVLCP
ncbi:hypothetical protein TNCT_209531 [Trichonephila clavata]|uniref:Uncharacterized protein n=1 Tax=Trichonephila clavata TaxID=2740835 RepID=A0A8X6JX68_TRICU|nr:hypothetical protein TNCT_209531 [Trichonephila clavata]